MKQSVTSGNVLHAHRGVCTQERKASEVLCNEFISGSCLMGSLCYVIQQSLERSLMRSCTLVDSAGTPVRDLIHPSERSKKSGSLGSELRCCKCVASGTLNCMSTTERSQKCAVFRCKKYCAVAVRFLCCFCCGTGHKCHSTALELMQCLEPLRSSFGELQPSARNVSFSTAACTLHHIGGAV